MKNMLVIIFLCVTTGCATSVKTQTVQLGDESLSCEQIKIEFSRLDQAQKEVDDKRGATGTNVAAALFWLPGLYYTYYDAAQANEAIGKRRSHLSGMYDSKLCK